jgi:hypothetical protein
MATDFNVSEEAMYWRLVNMGLKRWVTETAGQGGVAE